MVWDWVFQVCECHHKKGPGLKRVQRKIVFQKGQFSRDIPLVFGAVPPKENRFAFIFHVFRLSEVVLEACRTAGRKE